VKEGATLGDVVTLLGNEHAKDKKEMFWVGGKVRPGILVLVNDVDWELLEKDNTKLEDKDIICFISTLHGG
jgi:ubiquitin related modifier 1